MLYQADIDHAKEGYATRVWDAVRLVSENITDPHSFSTTLDALESILIPAMSKDELEKLNEIKNAMNEVIDYLYTLKEMKMREIEERNEILSGSEEIMKLNTEIDNAIYQANLLRFKLLSKIAYRIFVMRDTPTETSYNLEEDIANYIESFVGEEP